VGRPVAEHPPERQRMVWKGNIRRDPTRSVSCENHRCLELPQEDVRNVSCIIVVEPSGSTAKACAIWPCVGKPTFMFHFTKTFTDFRILYNMSHSLVVFAATSISS
jgi:hypothetical protein